MYVCLIFIWLVHAGYEPHATHGTKAKGTRPNPQKAGVELGADRKFTYLSEGITKRCKNPSKAKVIIKFEKNGA